MKPKFYIIVLNYNNWKDTVVCLDSILEMPYNNYQIIVVDNCSTDDSIVQINLWAQGKLLYNNSFLNYSIAIDKNKDLMCFEEDYLQIYSNKILLIKANLNNGYAAGNNIGIRYAKIANDFDYLWILNNDTYVASNALNKAYDFFSKFENENWGVLGTCVNYYHNPEVIQSNGLGTYNYLFAFSYLERSNRSKFKKVFFKLLSSFCAFKFLYGASLIFTKMAINDLGSFDENYFLYFEEQDIAYHLKSKNIKFSICKDVVVFHKEGGTINSDKLKSKSLFSDFYYNRNKLIFTKKYYPIALPFVIGSIILTAIRRLTQKQFKNFKMLLHLIYLFFCNKKAVWGNQIYN